MSSSKKLLPPMDHPRIIVFIREAEIYVREHPAQKAPYNVLLASTTRCRSDGNTYTTAGVTAGMGLAPALVEEDLGGRMALKVARELVLYLRRAGGQSQFGTALSLQASDRQQIEVSRSWALDNLGQDLPVEKLAAKAGMSPRNFARVFLKDTGTTPARFVERLRVEAARRRLEESHDKLERVANDCGFGSIRTLRRSFLRVLHVPPNDYRNRFADLSTN